ncbi:sodium:solute symporter family protein [Caldisphaera lagunensis]|nr:sodium:solute symporter [Caldisphaera lagunensis]
MFGLVGWIVFWVLFAVFVFLGFFGSRWRRGDLSQLHEWALAGRKLGVILVWFLVGADLYTAYTFVAVPSLVYASGAVGFFAVPYVAITFAIAMLFMPILWEKSRQKGYITAADFAGDVFNSKTLAILIALTGIVAELPYIALQIDGMRAVLSVMLLGYSGGKLASEWALIISFIILAAFVYTSGLRGATLGAVFKDVLIWISIIALIVVVPLKYGGFGAAFADAAKIHTFATGLETLKPLFASAFVSLFIGSALALYLYPHAVNGSLSAESASKLRLSTALLPLYGIGLAILALMGILVYSDPAALNITKVLSGLASVPAIAVTAFPDWFAAIILLGIFVGGLVPAAIMAIAQANLLTRNIIKPFKKDLTPKGETEISKWASVVFKFIALAFVFLTPLTYAIQLQLLGGIIILTTLPAVFIGLLTNKLDKYSLIVGWFVSLISSIYLVLLANHFKTLSSSTYLILGHPIYIGIIGLGINLAIVLIGTLIKFAIKK